jgi:hypothetical protein
MLKLILSGDEMMSKLESVETIISEKMKFGVNEIDLATFERTAYTLAYNLNKTGKPTTR